MRKRWVRLIAVLLALSLVAAACGDDDSDSSSDTGSSDAADALADAQAAQADAEAAQADAEAAAASAEADADAAESALDDAEAAAADVSEFAGEIIRITGPERSPEEWGALQTALDQFGEEAGMQIIYTGSADWESEINVQIAAGNPPDISMFPQPGKLADFARDDLVVALPDASLDAIAPAWGAAPLSFGEVDGAQYGVPVKNTLKSLVWYKPAVFEAGGYDIPETWEELLALTDTMIADGTTPWCVGIESGQATGWTFTDWTEDLMLRFQGGEAYDQWVSNELKFSDPAVIEIFDAILGLWNTPGAVFAGGGSIASSHFASDPAEGLAADDCAMVRQASFFSGFLPDGVSDEVAVFYFPSIGDGSRPVLGSGTLAAAFQDRPAVWAVMEYLGSGEYANRRQVAQQDEKGGAGQLSGFNSSNLDLDRSLWEPLEASFIEILQSAEVFRFDGSDLMPADVGAGTFWTEATAMVNGEKDAAAAAAAIDASWPDE